MSIPWMMGIAALIYLILQDMTSLYGNTNKWIESQVALDNIAIETAKEDRSILEFLRSKNQTLMEMETAHHPNHDCSGIPVPYLQEACEVADELAEAEIRFFVNEARIEAQTRWTVNGFRAQSILLHIDPRLKTSRPLTLPVDLQACWCGLDNRFYLLDGVIRYQMKGEILIGREIKIGVRLLGDSLSQVEKWDYILETGDR